MPDEKTPEKPKQASEETTVRAYAEAQKLRKWQVLLLQDRVGLDVSMAPKALAEKLDELSKERI